MIDTKSNDCVSPSQESLYIIVFYEYVDKTGIEPNKRQKVHCSVI